MSRDAGELVAKPVMNTSEGRKIGKVKDAIFDPEKHELCGLLIETDDGDMFLDRKAVRGLGSDAVTVDAVTAVTRIEQEPQAKALMESGIHLRGTKVITESGDSLGTLDKIMLDDDGSVASYQTSNGVLGMGGKHDVLPSQVMKIGTDAMIVSGSAAEPLDGTSNSASATPETVNAGTGARAAGSKRPVIVPVTAQGSVQSDAGDISASTPTASARATEPEGTITAAETPEDPTPVAAGAVTNRSSSSTTAPQGTDPSKETLVRVPDSQPGNLIDDEQ